MNYSMVSESMSASLIENGSTASESYNNRHDEEANEEEEEREPSMFSNMFDMCFRNSSNSKFNMEYVNSNQMYSINNYTPNSLIDSR